jgi:amino acid permease
MVMAALGEMAAWLPLPSGFTGYAHRFVDPALGFSLGWNYWFKVRDGLRLDRSPTNSNLTHSTLS